jgi:putative RNA 2'-phosphotransferase
MKENEFKILSKMLSLILRHKLETIGIQLDKNGWTSVDKLIENINLNQEFQSFHLNSHFNLALLVTKDILDEIVATNNKKRFEYSSDGSMIRARQGHSVDVDLGYKPVTPPEVLYHGTSEDVVDSIFENGIEKRNRHHVHLSENHETAMAVGKRHGKPCALTVDCKSMVSDGYEFFKTDNGVWLVDHVPSAYIYSELRFKSKSKTGNERIQTYFDETEFEKKLEKDNGISRYRFEQNPAERIFVEEFLEQDKWSNTLEYILSSYSNIRQDVTDEQRAVAMTIIQWMGSPCGQLFLQVVAERCKKEGCKLRVI